MHMFLSRFFEDSQMDERETITVLCDQLLTNNVCLLTHPLGFLQAVAREEEVEYRLNIWGSKFGRKKELDWPIHTHRFDFESKVLAGSLTDERLDVVPALDGDHFLYRVVYEAGGSFLIPVGEQRFNLRTRETSTFSAGDRYAMFSEDFHLSMQKTKLAVSLMLLGRIAASPPLVIGNEMIKRSSLNYVPLAVPVAEVVEELLSGIATGSFW